MHLFLHGVCCVCVIINGCVEHFTKLKLCILFVSCLTYTMFISTKPGGCHIFIHYRPITLKSLCVSANNKELACRPGTAGIIWKEMLATEGNGAQNISSAPNTQMNGRQASVFPLSSLEYFLWWLLRSSSCPLGLAGHEYGPIEKPDWCFLYIRRTI